MKLYFNALKTKFDTVHRMRIGMDQNGNPIYFLGAVSKLPPFLVGVNILCESALGFEGLDPSCEEGLRKS